MKVVAAEDGDRYRFDAADVAPAGPFDRPSFEKGLEVLKTRYQPVFTERLFDTHRYLAGTDAVRGADLQAALDDSSVKAVFAARGGYGSMRLLPSLSLTSPKWIVGFSDITALHCAAQVKGWQSLHAPVLTQLGKQPADVVAHFFALLEGAAVVILVLYLFLRNLRGALVVHLLNLEARAMYVGIGTVVLIVVIILIVLMLRRA